MIDLSFSFFNEWKEQVIAEIPADKLLVFEVKEGWNPLCKFLGVPVPDTPFPNVNDTKSIQKRIMFMKGICYTAWSSVPVLVAVGSYYLF